MEFIKNTMFEVKVSNSVRNQTQHVPGKFGEGTGSGFTPDNCSAGMLCVQNGLIPSEGYESVVDAAGNARILNGNTWYFNAAADGKAGGAVGDHTGIFAFDNYDVNRAVSGDNRWNVGINTLGIGLPEGERGDFCEILVGEQYAFGIGNFTADPADNKYATVANGLLTPVADKPASGSGVYFEILRSVPVNEGASFWGNGYILRANRA